MKKSIAMKWAEALESGEYKQGTGQLRTKENEFCCLGVLCNMHAQANPKVAAQQDNPVEYFGKDEFPPDVVMNWSGLKDSSGAFYVLEDDPYYGMTNVRHELVDLNDSGKTFPEIAKVIRKHYKKL